jgi:hypothetical protein
MKLIPLALATILMVLTTATPAKADRERIIVDQGGSQTIIVSPSRHRYYRYPRRYYRDDYYRYQRNWRYYPDYRYRDGWWGDREIYDNWQYYPYRRDYRYYRIRRNPSFQIRIGL